MQKENDDGIMLNAVIETHWANCLYYEITIKTAMKINDFDLSDGQFAIQVFDDGATIKQNQKGTVVIIGEIWEPVLP